MDELEGAGIVVTRPADRGQQLCRSIAARGGRALAFPTITIDALAPAEIDPPQGDADWLIFTSVPAVEYGLAQVEHWLGPASRIAAIGTATAEALQAAGIEPVIQPSHRQETEGLLELPEFNDIHDQEVLLVKGRGGRELLRDTLADRGASVRQATVYARRIPEQSSRELLDWWRAGRLDAIVVSSRAGLENLHAMLDDEGRRFLSETTLVAPTARMIKLVRQLGIVPEPVISKGASDDAVIDALCDWWQSRQARRHEQRPQDSR